jgi:hypothetical protein
MTSTPTVPGVIRQADVRHEPSCMGNGLLNHDPAAAARIRPSPSGYTITLVIDEPETRDTTEDAEDTWLPVLAALQRHLTEAGQDQDHPGQA